MLQSKTSTKGKLWRAKRGAKKSVKAEKTRSHLAPGGTKQDAVLALLRQPSGASIEAMMKATGWQQHSVRGFLAGVVKKRLKLKLGSAKVDGGRVYRIAGAEPGQSGSRQI
jgi:Protein of unknown function (DUF3489)